MRLHTIQDRDQLARALSVHGTVSVGSYSATVEHDTMPENPREYGESGVSLALEHRNYTLGDKDASDALLDLIKAELNQLMIAKFPDQTDGGFDISDESVRCTACNPTGDSHVADDCPDGVCVSGWIDNPFYLSDDCMYEAMALLMEHCDQPSDFYVQKVYLYDHSGITISTAPFSCRWDSGLAGYAFISKSDAESIFEAIPDTHRPADVETLANNLISGDVQEYDDYLTGNVYQMRVSTPDDEYADSCCGFIGDEGRTEAISHACDYLIHRIEADNATILTRIKVMMRNKVPYRYRQAEMSALADNGIQFIKLA